MASTIAALAAAEALKKASPLIAYRAAAPPRPQPVPVKTARRVLDADALARTAETVCESSGTSAATQCAAADVRSQVLVVKAASAALDDAFERRALLGWGSWLWSWVRTPQDDTDDCFLDLSTAASVLDKRLQRLLAIEAAGHK